MDGCCVGLTHKNTRAYEFVPRPAQSSAEPYRSLSGHSTPDRSSGSTRNRTSRFGLRGYAARVRIND